MTIEKSEGNFADFPSVPAEVWEELRKLQAFQEALTRAQLDMWKIGSADAHSRTLKGIADAELAQSRKR